MEEADRLDAFLAGCGFGVVVTTMVLLTFVKIYG